MSKVKEIEIKIEGKEWEEALDKAFEKANKKAKIDGFRPGKAPKDVFVKKYGKEVLYQDAADLVIEKAYMQMLEDNKEIVGELVAKPEITFKNIDDKGIEFNFVLTLRPEVKLGKYKGLKVEKEKAEVAKEELEQAIENIRNRYAENVLKEEKIENGDIAIIDFDGSVDGVPFDGGKAENYALTIGSGMFIPGFEEQLIGLKAGEEKDVVVTFPKDYHAEDLKGKEAVFKVKVHEVKEVKVPELDKEFFADLAMEGVDSVETLEAEISKNILEHKMAEIENKYMDALLDEAAKNVEVEIPEAMINEELDRMIKQYGESLQMQGITLEQFYQFTNSDEEALRGQMTEEAKKRITYRLMLEEIAKTEKIEISDKDAEKQAKEYADKYGMDKDEFLKLFGGLEMVKYDLQMRKAMEILKGEEK
ncbi:MAG: trigger factor [Bacilli bacterium]|nr:trigger factor [Bacilli bacterium]